MTRRPEDTTQDGRSGAAGTAAIAELRRHMDDLVARVPRHAIRAVIDEIDNTSVPNGERARHLRDALVEHFNRLRPMKARRLFTSLFEPFLVDDHVLYRAREPIPGLIQRVDMGGIWQALSRLGFPTLAMEVQNRLDDLSQDAILDQVLTGPEAMAMREAMRGEAARFLALLQTNRRAAEEFLILANREALKDARQRTPHLTVKAPIDVRSLAFVQAVLEDNAALLPLAERMRQDIAEIGAAGELRQAEVDGQAAMLVGYVREVRKACPARDMDEPVAWLPPLVALNIKHRYDVILRYVREYGGPMPGDNHPLHQALFGHFSACCTTIVQVIRAVFGDLAVQEGHVLSLHRPVRELLDTAVTRFEQSLAALSGAGFLSNRLIGPRIRPMLAEVSRALTSIVMPLAVERAQAATTARNGPAPDHDDLIWLLDFVWRWGATLGSVGYASPELQAMRTRMLDNGHAAFLQAIKIDEDEDLTRRMDHLVRINRVLAAIGESIGPWISPVSQGLHRVVDYHLDVVDEIAPEAQFVIDHFIAAVRKELGRSRHWQSVDLVAILRLYESRAG